MWDPPERLIFFPRSSSSSTRLAVGRQRLAKGRWRGSSSDLGGVKGPHAMLSRLALPTQPSAREPSKIRGGDEHIEQLEPRGRAAERRHGPHARCTDLLRNDGSGVADAELDEVGEDIDARAEVFGVGEQPLEDKVEVADGGDAEELLSMPSSCCLPAVATCHRPAADLID
ncbi:Os06g0296800 [Oryza sativa Japonica Group]|uniref:Os06g0296800 protein n=2 Tax=Oryza sativa subsp. japonica TaxID=39947 RepID=Q5Z6J4_ORYSJ|nr:hypothetical protein [Oryza sativa Japonica Group]BAS97345.1 Os06g0296800 [Oryza sativa Japonica Group]